MACTQLLESATRDRGPFEKQPLNPILVKEQSTRVELTETARYEAKSTHDHNHTKPTNADKEALRVFQEVPSDKHLFEAEATTRKELHVIIISADKTTSAIEFRVDGTCNDKLISAIKNCLETVTCFRRKQDDPENSRFSFSYRPDVAGPRRFIAVIESTETGNFEAVMFVEGKTGRKRHKEEETKYKHLSLLSFVHVSLLLVLSVVYMFNPEMKQALDYWVVDLLTLGTIIRWAASTVIQIITVFQFFTASYKCLKCGSIDMDVFIALKANMIYLCSVYSVLRTAIFSDFQGMDFFGTSLNFMAFCLLGRYVDAFVKQKRFLVMSKHKGLAMEAAILLNSDHSGNVTRKELDTRLMQEQMMNGTDVLRSIFGATTDGKWEQRHMNENGVLHYTGRINGSESVVSRIAHLVESDQTDEGSAQELASAISKFFMFSAIPFSLFAGLLCYITGKFYGHPESWIPNFMDVSQVAFQVLISVAAITSPCALAIAAEIAILVAAQVGANLGVVFQSGRALASQDKVNCVVFSKRILTVGKPKFVDRKMVKPVEVEEFLKLVAVIAGKSRHPLAKAIMEYTQKFTDHMENSLWPEPHDFVYIAGRGVKAIVQNKEMLVGNKSLMVEHSVAIPDDTDNMLAGDEGTGRTMILVSVSRELTGVLEIDDPLKPGARDVISILNSMNVKTLMVTGDNQGAASSIATEVGIELENVVAEAKPEQKVKKIKKLQVQGYVVVMVDAGTTTSPSFIAADVGIATGAGTGIATEVADVVITSNCLEDVITAIDLSNKTIRRNNLNCICAVIHNLLGISITTAAPFLLGFPLPPWVAGTIAACSSLLLVTLSYSLKMCRRPKQLAILEMNGVLVE